MSAVLDQADDLPFEMREALRWLVWLSVPVPGKKPRKVPFYANGQPRHGALDTAADQQYLVSFDDAQAALAQGNYTGLGFALGPDGSGSYWQGVDLDNLSEHPDLAMLAEDLPGYTETSPSGKGVHAIGYGRAFQALGSNATGIEAYSAGRYFTVTADGAGLSNPVCIADFVERVLRPKHSPAAPTHTSAEILEYIDPKTITELRSALSSMRADDRDSWVANGQRLKKLGERGRALWLEWSQQSDKYDPADAARVWDSFTADHTGYQAIFKAAQAQGWLNPLSGAVPSPAQPAPTEIAQAIANALQPLNADDIARAAIPHPHAFTKGDAGLFPEAEVTVIGAPGREGKTTLMMAIATHYALGRPLAGLAPAEVRSVLIYSGEDDRGQYARKAAAQWARLGTTDQALLLNNLLIPDLHSPELSAWREIVRLENRAPVRGPVVETLIEAIQALSTREFPPGLAIFETASTLSDAEEDNPGHKALIAALKHIAKRTGLAVILVHHTSQAAASSLPDLTISEADIRGGTTLVNNARQTHLVVNLASVADAFPESDARTVLRSLVAPGEQDRITALICLSSSKAADPAPIFMRWENVAPYGPRMVEVTVPARLAGRSWRALRGELSGARAEMKADKKAESGLANVRLVVKAVADIQENAEQPTANKVSTACGRNPGWAKPYLNAAVEQGELVRSTESVPRSNGLVDVYRLAGEVVIPWKSE
ncbi:AAA family ATPase [Pseudoxanthomonas sacheonensis]|uniref:AAA family ATPase n=1 Tax=Pseudoxanthomonas sacheonensis TaxID=443615 RepID=UPI0013D83B19|nr:AAA family ATPase [Pseudoxanthomonas sacheonensis]KAF1706264.1 hypothetical protein CSC73_16290 [Pseudoxanthomonas sacheonensis]